MTLSPKSANELVEEVRNKIHQLQAVERIITSKIFREIYSNCPEPQKLEAQNYITLTSPLCLRHWLKELISKSKSLEEKTVRELREIGQRLGVERYFNMPKAELLSEIKGRSS